MRKKLLKERKMKRQTGNYFVVTLSAIIMVLTVYIGNSWLKRFKVDMTEEKLYTLSNGSKDILKKLNTPLTLKLYYSKTSANKGTEGLRIFNNYFFYVKDLLEEYVAHSRNNLRLQVIDPRPDTKEEEEASTYGLKKFQLTETEKYFFGLVVENNVGTEKIIEFFGSRSLFLLGLTMRSPHYLQMAEKPCGWLRY